MFRNAHRSVAAMFCLVLSLSAAACGSRQTDETATTEPSTQPTPEANVAVTQIELGRDVDTNNRVTVQTDQFKSNDVIYLTVLTTGSAPSATLRSVWTDENGQIVEETQQVIAPTGDLATAFHVSKPEGLPAGKYRVEISLNGTPVQVKEFQIVKA